MLRLAAGSSNRGFVEVVQYLIKHFQIRPVVTRRAVGPGKDS